MIGDKMPSSGKGLITNKHLGFALETWMSSPLSEAGEKVQHTLGLEP